MASEEAQIEEGERDLIHSIFEFGDTIVREVMVPRPDIVAVEDDKAAARRAGAGAHSTATRACRSSTRSSTTILGICYAKDVLKALHQGKQDMPLAEIMREAHFVPETKKVADLLREMQQREVPHRDRDRRVRLGERAS